MKQLKFEHQFAVSIQSGKKTATFRVHDDKDIRPGDIVQLIDKVDSDRPSSWQAVGELHIRGIRQAPLKELSSEHIVDAESFANTDEMIQTFRRFYGEHIAPDTMVTLLSFSFTPYEQPKKYLQNKTADEPFVARQAKLYADGGSRGNPGPSALGFVVLDHDDQVLHADNKYLGVTTNNQAEYHALIAGLEWCLHRRVQSVSVFLDSMLVVNQLKGIFKVKNRELWSLYETSRDLSKQFQEFSVTHVPRELNKLADAQVNQALDAVKGTDISQ